MESTHPTWNDQRMDEFAERSEENSREARGEIRGLRTELKGETGEMRGEIRGLRTELKSETGELRREIQGLRGEMNGRFANLEVKIDRRLDILCGAMATGFVGLIISHLIG